MFGTLARGPQSNPIGDTDEKKQHFANVVGLLLSAGYFRARINALSEFDRVVGGLAWLLTAANVDVSVDVIFRENSNIGQKIKLAENIVEALQAMKCPIELQAHQIQGEDFAHIFPVVQWLVKKVIEVREETGESVRRLSEFKFRQQSFRHPDEKAAGAEHDPEAFVRKYRRAAGTKPPVELLKHVASVLLEYGSRSLPLRNTAKTDQDTAQEQEEENAALLSTMAGCENERISRGEVGRLVALQAEEIKQVSENYSEQQRLAEAEAGGSQWGGQLTQKREIAALQRQLQTLIDKISAMEQANTTAHEFLDGKRVELNQIVAQNEQIAADIKTYAAMESNANVDDLTALRSLVALNETLKLQEEQFRANCARQMQALKEKIEQAKSANNDDDMARVQQIEAMFHLENEKLQKLPPSSQPETKKYLFCNEASMKHPPGPS